MKQAALRDDQNRCAVGDPPADSPRRARPASVTCGNAVSLARSAYLPGDGVLADQVNLGLRGWMHRYESRVISSRIEPRLFQ